MHTEGKQKNSLQTTVDAAACNLASGFREAAQSCGGAQSGPRLVPSYALTPRAEEDWCGQ